jgi:hypothetical protein
VASGIVAATDDSGEPVTINCFNAEGDEICDFVGDVGLSVPVANLVADPGPSPMTCVASDSVGNFTTVNVFVQVLDTSAPYFTSTAANPTIVQAGEVTGTATVTLENGFAAEDVDGVDPNPVIVCETATGLTSSDALPAGENDVTCTVTDASGNSSDSSYVVRVDDVTHPKVTLNGASPQVIEAGTAYVELGATATDNVGIVGDVTIDAVAVNTIATGDYLVTYTAVDAAGNSTTAIRTVRVVDTQPPSFDGPLVDIVREALPDGTVTVSFIVTASDSSGVLPTVSCVPASGSTFPVGTTSVTCTATDAAGNSISETFDVTVLDSTAPTLTVPTTTITESATGPAGAIVDFAALVSASDAVDASPTVACTPPSGSTFPIGTTTVTCTATDDAGNSASASFNVSIVDTGAPTLSVPATTVTAAATGPAGAIVNYAALVTASDDVDSAPAVSCAPPSGSTFPVGSTSVTCTATDTAGNSASASFNVSVVDTGIPTLLVPAATVSQEATGPAGATVAYAALVSASDDVDATPTVACAPPSGSTFPVGTTTVTCTATDDAGNSAAAAFNVSVVDTAAPTLSVPATTVTAAATGPAGATVDFAALVTATDIVDAAPVISCAPPSGSTFAVGTTAVTCTATDAAGNSASASFNVAVVDGVAPTLNLPTSPVFELIQGPGGSTVNYAALVSATDLIDPSPAVDCTPVSGTTFAPGETSVNCTASDFSGNTGSGSFTVLVGYVGYGITPTKLSVKSGSSNPLMWSWGDENGNNLDSSADMQRLRVVDCGDPAIVLLDKAGDPGASGFRFKADLSWEFNWQSDDSEGNPLPRGEYCASVTNERTGQSLESPPIRVR